MLNHLPISTLDTDFVPETTRTVLIDLPELPNGAPIQLPVAVIDGSEPGPTCWISAAIHGDEINGVDIVRRLIRGLDPKQMRGRLLAVPIVDVYGFNVGDRYLPDRRDLNRTFPGSAKGSLASRLAHIFVTEIVDRCDAGIDLHTGAAGRANLPQVRGVFADPVFRDMANAFAAPVTMNSKIIAKSLRQVAVKRGIPYLLYEAGTAGTFNQEAIAIGVDGCLRVLQHLGIAENAPAAETDPQIVEESKWIRAPRSGVLNAHAWLGDRVRKRDVLAEITNTFGTTSKNMLAPFDGIVVGVSVDPLLQAGDAVFNIGRLPS